MQELGEAVGAPLLQWFLGGTGPIGRAYKQSGMDLQAFNVDLSSLRATDCILFVFLMQCAACNQAVNRAHLRMLKRLTEWQFCSGMPACNPALHLPIKYVRPLPILLQCTALDVVAASQGLLPTFLTSPHGRRMESLAHCAAQGAISESKQMHGAYINRVSIQETCLLNRFPYACCMPDEVSPLLANASSPCGHLWAASGGAPLQPSQHRS